jgi:hypothetical protein
MNISRFGAWGAVSRLIKNIDTDMSRAKDISLKRFVLYAEGKAKKHLRDQDLRWQRLSPKTLAAKVKKGGSNKILIDTSTYFQSITGWVHKDHALVGVKREARDKKGNVIANIARVHEFGSPKRNIPARPLWKPVMKETLKYMRGKGNPAKIYLEIIEKKYK